MVKVIELSKIHNIHQEEDEKYSGMEASYLKDINGPRVMMIIKAENKPMCDLIVLIHVGIEAQNPHIEDEYGNAPPGGKVSLKGRVFLEVKVFYQDYYNQQDEQGEAYPDPKSQQARV